MAEAAGSHAAAPPCLPDAVGLGAALAPLLAGRWRQTLSGGRRAAVLLVLYDRVERAHLLLTKRTETVAHPGQVSLPGGRAEPGDDSLAATAMRETFEEIGVLPSALSLIGPLDEVHTRASEFVVSPFVAVLGEPLRPSLDAGEVARLLEVPVAELLASDALLPERPSLAELRYPLDGEDVWGATARILRGFSAVVREALSSAPGPSRPPG